MQQLTPFTILGIIGAYFLVLILISWFTSRKAANDSFFIGDRNSNWILVAIGMVGASLSGVTFISVPGKVGVQSFSYMQMVFGFVAGYVFIMLVLLPLYYRLKLTSIYEYLKARFGTYSHKTGAAFFLLSRVIGASLRLYLVAMVMQLFVMDAFGVPFEATVAITILLIWVYTFKGGIKTIIWTDTIQTVSMLAAVTITIFGIATALNTDVIGLVGMVQKSEYSEMFFFQGGWSDPYNFFKQFFGGALIAIVMTGLDQDMMQKNLSCPNIRDAQKNMSLFSIVLIFANLLFLFLGAALYLYAASVGIEAPSLDKLFPIVALQSDLPVIIGIFFIVGLIAAAYSSADSALTALTTSFCIDFLDFKTTDRSEKNKKKTRVLVHIAFSFILFIAILIFKYTIGDDTTIVDSLFTAAGFTYGPLLGLFTFGIITDLKIKDNWVVPICIAAPILSYVIDANSAVWFNGFKLGFLTIALNGLLTFGGLLAISYRKHEIDEEAYPAE